MQFIIYILVYPFIWVISKLPFPLLYLFSDFVCFLVYTIFGYRKKVVRENIALTLPHLSEIERLNIEKKFYHYMCDMFLEMMKTMSISQKEMEKRFVFTNLDLYLDLEKKGKSIALLCAHYASYEWAVSMNYHITFEGYGIYKKINNKYFDKLVKDIRSKFKATLLSTRETIPTIEKNNKTKHLGVYGFASDQSPRPKPLAYWRSFMGVHVPVYTGAERMAREFDIPVVFGKMNRIKRGYYEVEFKLLTDTPNQLPPNAITDTYTEWLESQIKEDPSQYFWTHKRFKHAKNS